MGQHRASVGRCQVPQGLNGDAREQQRSAIMEVVTPSSLSQQPGRVVVKTSGRGGLLGLISPLFAFLMARQGLNGWQQRALREMEDDTVTMARRGYRIVSSEEVAMPLFGITYYRVTYRSAEQPM
jgi:hypothetical protein